MKTLITLTLSLLLAGGLKALDAKAIIVMEDDAQVVWITAASAANIEYKETEVAIDRIRKARSSLVSIMFYEPELFKEALALYENRDFAAAKEKFEACQESFENVEELPGNYSSLAGFYALECARKMGELEELAQMLESYRGQPKLTREHQKNQFEVYIAWDAVRTKSWPRLVSLTDDMLAQKHWTTHQIAQIYYCRGLALEAVDRPTDALNAFNGAFTADYTGSSEITRQATLACLRILKAHPDVQVAMQLFGTADEDPNSSGYALLQEAVALCELWKTALGVGQPLPAEYQDFLKYKVKAS